MNENTQATETLARIEHLQIDAEDKLTQIDTVEALRAWQRCYLGRAGAVTQLLRGISALPPAQRPTVGHVANRLRQRLETASAQKKRELGDLRLQHSLRSAALDVTLPGRAQGTGRLHPMTLILREMVQAFRTMGFQVMTGPEIETDDHNFTLLNMPPNHPARDMHDTFYVDAEASGLPRATNWVLRTHTSPNQVRVMWQQDPPIRVVVPGVCYRFDNPDPSHDWMFYQMEGFAIGSDITLPELKGTITGMVQALFGARTRVRFRGTYFPFTEPSLEADLQCTLCAGRGCRLCKGTGWVECIPGGIIHPQVLRNGGIDPGRYSGFAFGAGPNRIAALKYGVEDIRYLYKNDARFLEQFH